MNLLQILCSYWYECIKKEDVLEKDISINVRSKAILYPFDDDPFIFRKKDAPVKIENEKLNTYATTKAEGLEFFYGYPLLYYRDDKTDKQLVAPLFIIKVKFNRDGSDLFLSKDEQYPVCGIQALTKLGLRTEEIANINQFIEKLFIGNPKVDEQQLCSEALKIIEKEAEISIIEEINPLRLSNSKKLTKEMPAGLYNKSLVFARETTVFNIHLIKDLLDLKGKNDLEDTSLSFFVGSRTADKEEEITPVLPFPSNEYQISAIQDIFKHSFSVITGPPGTGKSQFISNLIVNLFLSGKTVLFVSHTGEAVDVVNTRINEQFRNLMLRTGKKELRQDLKGRFNEIIADSSKRNNKNISIDYIYSLWKTILEYRESLLKKDETERDFQQKYFHQKELKNILQIQGSIVKKLRIYFQLFILNFKLNWIKSRLEKLPSRLNFETKIRELEKEYYLSCQDFIRNTYLDKMLGSGKKIGLVNTFLNQVNSHRFSDEDINETSFINALRVLKIWSSTLKSLRGTFPLKANIFDYVIFDEASQIDLPSAAPALYRAKKAIIVGDPMQLTHIAGITKEIDYGLAKIHGLTEMKDIYPAKTRYCDVSLYKAAENYLPHSPILLTNHYRSEDQIISLCNQVFYEGRLKILSTLNYSKFPSSLPLGVQWEDVRGEVYKHPSGSRINQREVDEVNRIFQKVIKEISGTDLTVGVVTPYSRQRQAIYEKISSTTPVEVFEKHDVKILTAHQFQGSEKDIVIFSLVLTSKGNGNSDTWYNIYPQILNVALSRARYLLYIIGDKSFCEDRKGILGKIKSVYEKIKDEEKLEEYDLYAKFDTPTEKMFFEQLQKIKLDKLGYKLIPKLVVKRYTLDFAIVGKKKINVEIDGTQHEIIEGMPVLEDVERDEFLRKEGWEILRFPNFMILSEMPKVIDELLTKLK
ncbi:AAA domain-containing protein [Thermoflavifilum thermophilum]|uniref:Superfamily I DNA and/or RNA helicase n=1 Tax=Thermoflavifilum thermophilum TaxID=1393122 RepID=A0A1I7MXN0_9BACT|nr:AAA domain-containing protein [Thermoflavifilum thermophilum]SFV27173.1 Superfamily I DNA and/or RNA helicase [Thermoflavifilum thermophilum]